MDCMDYWKTTLVGKIAIGKCKLISFAFLDFSNVISKQDVKVLAEADDQEVVREVQVNSVSKLNYYN